MSASSLLERRTLGLTFSPRFAGGPSEVTEDVDMEAACCAATAMTGSSHGMQAAEQEEKDMEGARSLGGFCLAARQRKLHELEVVTKLPSKRETIAATSGLISS